MHDDDPWEHWVAEIDGRSIGAMRMCDPHLESTHYWGDSEPNPRALDIWIGDAADRSKGYGEAMMRLGFVPVGRQAFSDEDDCVVHTLTRSDWRAHNQGALPLESVPRPARDAKPVRHIISGTVIAGHRGSS